MRKQYKYNAPFILKVKKQTLHVHCTCKKKENTGTYSNTCIIHGQTHTLKTVNDPKEKELRSIKLKNETRF
jgi:hypothetical protein